MFHILIVTYGSFLMQVTQLGKLCCVDLTRLNKGVQQEMHPMPSVDESLCRLGKRRYFIKLDANSGCWLPLGKESKLLTTFVTPFVQYCFNCLPFGICCAPEIFQPKMLETFKDADGVICQMDNGAECKGLAMLYEDGKPFEKVHSLAGRDE